MTTSIPSLQLSLSVAFFLGFGFYLGSSTKGSTSNKDPGTREAEDTIIEEEDPQDIADGDLSTIRAGLTEPCKLVCAAPPML